MKDYGEKWVTVARFVKIDLMYFHSSNILLNFCEYQK